MLYQKVLRKLRQFKSRATIKYATRQILRRRSSGSFEASQQLEQRVEESLTVMMSYKVTSPERLAILATVLSHVHHALAGSGIPMKVIDASANEYLHDTKRMFQEMALPVSFTCVPKRLGQAYLDMLQQITQQYVYVQFDDFITVGLTPEFLQAACQLLEKYAGLVDVVCIQWPLEVIVSDTERAVNVIDFERATNSRNAQDTYFFGFDKPHSPVFKEQIGKYEFGIFENFQYGFFFNHLVAPVHDYRRRIQWYMKHVSSTSVHEIEVAAIERTRGPFWTHIAMCLSDVCLLDVDYAHTHEALRPEIEQNKSVFDALNRGYVLKVLHKQKQIMQ